MNRATPAMADDLSAFLRFYVDIAMFPLNNIRAYGIDGSHDYAMRFWLARKGGAISDVVGLSNSGMVMPVCPNADWAAVGSALAGEVVKGFIGPSTQVRPLMDWLGACGLPAHLDDDEPHFALPLADLRIPDGPGAVVPIATAPRETVMQWLLDYQTEALNIPANEAAETAIEDYRRYCEDQSHVVLMQGAIPLAMTGFNARLPDAVQIGGVYTPPHLRGQGHARRALALHLAQARAKGVSRAVLFSASDSASRAYRAIGFEQIGHWALCLLAQPFTIQPR